MNYFQEYQETEDTLLAGTYQKIPVVAAKARGSRIWDPEGKEYLDFMSGYGVAILGHSFPAVKEAIIRQMDDVSITHASVYSPARSEFLRVLSGILPSDLNKTVLVNSGTEAVEVALKTALKSTGKKKIVSMEKAYHGKTAGALSITHSNKYRKSFGDLLLQSVEFVKFGNIEALEKAMSGGDVAAVFLEPVQGEGGMNIPPEGYLKAVREITTEKGALLVFDEIQSGLGRTGKMWAHEHWNVTPDIMTIGKGIGGGIPLAVTSGKSEFMDVLEVGEHSTTTGGNPLACAAGTSVIHELKNGYVDAARDTGKYLLSRLQEEFDQLRIVSGSRGIGMMIAMELKIRFLPVLMGLIEQGLITLYSGINTIRMLPPYIISRNDVDEAISIIRDVLERQMASMGVK